MKWFQCEENIVQLMLLCCFVTLTVSCGGHLQDRTGTAAVLVSPQRRLQPTSVTAVFLAFNHVSSNISTAVG